MAAASQAVSRGFLSGAPSAEDEWAAPDRSSGLPAFWGADEDEIDVGTVESYRSAQEITFRKA